MMTSYQRPVTSNQRGFTLIEVLLASFIFMSVVTIAVGSFTSQITLQSSSEAQRSVQQTAQSIVEAISRDIRTIEEWHILDQTACQTFAGPPAVCGNRIDFIQAPGSPGGDKSYDYEPDDFRLNFNGSQLNDPSKVEVNDFFIEGFEPNIADRLLQTRQPFVILRLSVRTPLSGRQEEQASLTIRTVINSRLFDKYR